MKTAKNSEKFPIALSECGFCHFCRLAGNLSGCAISTHLLQFACIVPQQHLPAVRQGSWHRQGGGAAGMSTARRPQWQWFEKNSSTSQTCPRGTVASD